ncbi:putative RTA1 domain protein [Thermoascus aurantiacus ATCC 26904]
MEVIGYVGRLLLHRNPWSLDGFKVQIVCLILAPTLICAGIYLTLKHVALAVGPGLSRLQPRLYTWIFIPLDVFCLVLQGVGGSVDASAETDPERLRIGNNIIIAGIVLQVAVLSGFGLLSLDFFWRVRRHHHHQQQQQCHSPVDNDTESTTTRRRVWKDPRFRIFCTSVAAAYLGILTRCIYRIVEMAGGWANPIMQNEVDFIVLEGVMILYPAILLTVVPPGIYFPQMAMNSSTTRSDHEDGSPPALEEEQQQQQGSSSVGAVSGDGKMGLVMKEA